MERGFEVLEKDRNNVLEIMQQDPNVYAPEGDDLISDDWVPQRATEGSAGYDLRSTEEVVLEPHKLTLVHTGVTAYMQTDEELQVRPRSGLAMKHMVSVLNAPGTVDSDYYPNEIGVLMMNYSDNQYVVSKGERIAQAVFHKYLTTDNDEPKSKRSGGFGSTGK